MGLQVPLCQDVVEGRRPEANRDGQQERSVP